MTNKSLNSKTLSSKALSSKKRYQDLLKRKLERGAVKVKQDKLAATKQDKTMSLDEQSLDVLCPEFPELDKILQMPRFTKEHAFVRAVCSVYKAKRKAIKKLKQSMAWLRMENKN